MNTFTTTGPTWAIDIIKTNPVIVIRPTDPPSLLLRIVHGDQRGWLEIDSALIESLHKIIEDART